MDRALADAADRYRKWTQDRDTAIGELYGPSSTWTYLINDDPFPRFSVLTVAGSNIGTAIANAAVAPLFGLVTLVLREFPRVRRAALAGEEVIIETREGNLVLRAEVAENAPLYGSMKDRVVASEDDIDRPTLPDSEWDSAL